MYTEFGSFANADLISMQIAFDVSAQINIPITLSLKITVSSG